MQIFCKIPWVKAESLHFSHIYLFYFTKLQKLQIFGHFDIWRNIEAFTAEEAKLRIPSVSFSSALHNLASLAEAPDKRITVC